jgi:hypothetical protein
VKEDIILLLPAEDYRYRNRIKKRDKSFPDASKDDVEKAFIFLAKNDDSRNF